MRFIFDDAVKQLGVNGMYFIIEGMHNKVSDDAFIKMEQSYFSMLNIDDMLKRLTNSEIVQGFRDLHTKVNCSGKKFVSSPENLIEYYIKNRSLPSINLIVDIYNYVSLQSELALGAHDTDFIEGDISLRLASGKENFLPLGYSKPVHVKSGEYCYIDDANDVLCRLEVRQVEKTKVNLGTKSCFYIVQGNARTPREYIIEQSKKLIALTTQFCGGSVTNLYIPS